MDLRRLPNLGALRVFEAAARLGSFSRAAAELFVTHGAISHQIRGLEADLAVPLFKREGKRVKLTDQGRHYAEQIRTALGSIAEATMVLRGGANNEKRLVISTLPSFAARWLMPRIGRFIEQHPHLDLEFRSTSELVDFEKDNVDIGIRLGRGVYPGLQTEKVLAETFFPACSPHLNNGELPRKPADLTKFTLLPSSDDPWQLWFAAAGLGSIAEPTHGAFYQDSAHLLEAAMAGQGIALVRRSLALDEIAAGRLVRLFDIESTSDLAYYLAYPPGAGKREPVQAFRTWLLAEIAVFREIADKCQITTPPTPSDDH